MTRGKSSPAQSAAEARAGAIPKTPLKLGSGIPVQFTFTAPPRPRSLNDDSLTRSAISAAIRECSLSREQIAERMTELTGCRITESMLNMYSAEAKQAYRLPAAWIRAFCVATANDALLRAYAEAAGLAVITQTEAELLELGRHFLIQKRSEHEIALLEKRLAGAEL